MQKLERRPALRYAMRTLARIAPDLAERRTLRHCAEKLNREGWFTFRGKPWTVQRLSMVIKTARVAALDHYAETVCSDGPRDYGALELAFPAHDGEEVARRVKPYLNI